MEWPRAGEYGAAFTPGMGQDLGAGGSEVARRVKREVGTKTVRVTLVRSTIGFDRRQAAVVRGLGLRRIGHSVELRDGPATRGMIEKVRHLVSVG